MLRNSVVHVTLILMICLNFLIFIWDSIYIIRRGNVFLFPHHDRTREEWDRKQDVNDNGDKAHVSRGWGDAPFDAGGQSTSSLFVLFFPVMTLANQSIKNGGRLDCTICLCGKGEGSSCSTVTTTAGSTSSYDVINSLENTQSNHRSQNPAHKCMGLHANISVCVYATDQQGSGLEGDEEDPS